MQRKHLFYTLISGVLLSMAWTSWGLAWALFVAFLPILWVEDQLSEQETKTNRLMFTYAYISFFTWNIISTWWVSVSTLGGGAAAVILNSLFYAILFTVFHYIKKKNGAKIGYAFGIVLWVAWEYFYINGEISWVWLVLGNGFANNTNWIQWYEYTGALGGSLWVLILNVLAYHIYKHNTVLFTKPYIILCFLFLFLMLSPIISSYYLLQNYQESQESITFSIIQPNIDPYDKFGGLSQDEQLDKMLNLIKKKADPKADFFILPETAIAYVSENNIEQSKAVRKIRQFMQAYPDAAMIVGATTSYVYPKGEKSETARVNPKGYYYDYFNTALQIDASTPIQKYHKSMLVIGVEMMPYPSFFNLFENFIISLGGISGTLGTQKERSIFINPKNKACVAPAICYESIYGEFFTGFITKGANLSVLITNDAWWGDTPGYKQHFSYSKLRAIENRRSLVRCANTGISAIINQKGEIEQQTQYWVEDVLNGSVHLNDSQTFYTKEGDFIGRIAYFILSFFLLSFLFRGIYTVIKRKI